MTDRPSPLYPPRQPFPKSVVVSMSGEASESDLNYDLLPTCEFQAFRRSRLEVETYLDDYARTPEESATGTVIGVKGSHGTGKTHLIRYLIEVGRNSKHHIRQIYVKAESSDFLHLYRRLVAQIDYPTLLHVNTLWLSKAAQQEAGKSEIRRAAVEVLKTEPEAVYDYLNRRLLSPAQVEGTYLEWVRGVTHYQDFLRAVSYMPDPELGRDAYEWFRGHELSPTVLKRLGIRRLIDDVEMARAALRFLAAAFCRARLPLLVYIDQIERLILDPDPEVSALNKGVLHTLAELFERDQNFLALAGVTEAWDELPEDFFARLRFRLFVLTGLSDQETYDVIRAYLATLSEVEEKAGNGIYPFTDEALHEMARIAYGNIRRVLFLAYGAFEHASLTRSLIGPEHIARAAHALADGVDELTALNEIKALLRDADIPFIEEPALSDKARVDLVVPHAAAPQAFIEVIQALSYEDDLRRAVQYARSVELFRDSFPFARLVLVVVGYLPPEMRDRLTEIVDYYLPYVDDEFSSQFGSILLEVAGNSPIDRMSSSEPAVLARTIKRVREVLEGALERQPQRVEIDGQSVLDALRCWSDVEALAEHPLARLNIVRTQMRTSGDQDALTASGVVLRNILREAIENLRPADAPLDVSDKRWRPYIILSERFVGNRSPASVASMLNISQQTYARVQAEALASLSRILMEREQHIRRLKAGSIIEGGDRIAKSRRDTMGSAIPAVPSFLGRDVELEYFRARLDGDHLAVIVGMPGVGKTALGAELVRRYRHDSNVLWMSFLRGFNTDSDSLFWEIADNLTASGEDEFANFLQLERERSERHHLALETSYLLRVLSKRRYTLCFDDYHLANGNQDITALLSVLKEKASHSTFDLIVMGRERPGFAPGAEPLRLSGLDRGDARRLLDEAGLAQLPDRLFDQLYVATTGNPMFLRLFVNSAIRGRLEDVESDEATAQVEGFIKEWHRADDVTSYLLHSVYEVLDPDEQLVAELMSAFRIPFNADDETVIELFATEGIENSSVALNGLLRKSISVRLSDGRIDCHPLIRQFFYARLRGRLSLKRRMHARIGEYYELEKDDPLEAAYHYREAGDHVRCVNLLDTRAERLIGTGKARWVLEELSLLKSAELPSFAQVIVDAVKGQAYAFLGEHDKALSYFDNALSGFERSPLDSSERRRAADIARQMGRAYGWRDNFEMAHEYMRRGAKLLGDLLHASDRAVAALLHTHTGSLYFLQDQLSEAEAACLKALDLLGVPPAESVLAETYKVLSVIYDETGRWEQASDYARKSLAIWERLGNRHQLAQVRDNLGTLQFYRGDFREAESLAVESLAFWENVGAQDEAAAARLNLGMVYLWRGEWSEAEALFYTALHEAQQTGNVRFIALAYNNLGLLKLQSGDLDTARQLLLLSVTQKRTPENCRWLGETELGLGHIDRALSLADQSYRMAVELGRRYEEGVSLRTLALIFRTLGRTDEARSCLLRSLQTLSSLGARYEIARTYLDLGLLEAHSENRSVSEKHFIRAIAIFERVGAGRDRRRALHALRAYDTRSGGQEEGGPHPWPSLP